MFRCFIFVLIFLLISLPSSSKSLDFSDVFIKPKVGMKWEYVIKITKFNDPSSNVSFTYEAPLFVEILDKSESNVFLIESYGKKYQISEFNFGANFVKSVITSLLKGFVGKVSYSNFCESKVTFCSEKIGVLGNYYWGYPFSWNWENKSGKQLFKSDFFVNKEIGMTSFNLKIVTKNKPNSKMIIDKINANLKSYKIK